MMVSSAVIRDEAQAFFPVPTIGMKLMVITDKAIEDVRVSIFDHFFMYPASLIFVNYWSSDSKVF